jgi:hypothetical protein
VVNRTNASVELQFWLPAVDSYSATLFCASSNLSARSIDAVAPFIVRKFPLTLAVADFEPSANFSRLRCNNTDNLPRRWCEFRNLAHSHRLFFFFSPAQFSFPAPFLYPGPRAPPFHKEVDQLLMEPIVLQNSISSFPHPLTTIHEFSYVYGVFHNYYMLWHTLFDFIIPLWHFLSINGRSELPSERRVYVRSDGVWQYFAMMEPLSSFPIVVLDHGNPGILITAGILGIPKLELDPRPNRTHDDSISFVYNINRTTARGLREATLAALSLPDAAGGGGPPLVVLVARHHEARAIANFAALGAAVAAGCPHCEVQTLELERLPVREQIARISRASALIGLHGSGLAHALWMAESRPGRPTALVEVVPFGYCRDWYRVAADTAGVAYVRVVGRRPAKASRELEECWGRPGACATVRCHDLLRDQRPEVDIAEFAAVWRPIADAFT